MAKRSKQAPLLAAFISHAKADEKKARAIAEGLESRGFKCWIAPRDVRAGRSYGDEIIRGIESTRSFVLVLSKASNDSAFVAREVERAVSKKKPIFAVRISNVEPAPSLELFISGTQWIDAFAGGVGPHVDRLANLLAEEEGVEPPQTGAGKDHPQPRRLPTWAVPVGAAAAVLLVLGAGLALWSGHERADPSLTNPVFLPSGKSEAEEQVAVAEPSGDTEVIFGGKPQSKAYSRENTALGVVARDPDFQACETASGDDAVAACDRAIASGKFAGRSLSYLYSDRGYMSMQKHELERALADLDEAARIDPTNFFAFWNRGAVYAAKANFDRAQEDFTTALALKPDKTSRAQIEEALNVVTAVAKAAQPQASDPSVITDPSKFWGDQQGVAGSAASSYPTDAAAMPPEYPAAIEASPPLAASPPMLPAEAPPMPVR
ncbi:MAG: toll/interleukin-1 receptor domain-containing protein [Methyloceanibacter sp.]